MITSLLSRNKIRAVKWTHMPIPDEVIAHVGDLTDRENIPLLDNREFIFKWIPGQRFRPTPNIPTVNNSDDHSVSDGNNTNNDVVDIILRMINLMMMHHHITLKIIVL